MIEEIKAALLQEEVTLPVEAETLGKIDLLVDEGVYASRKDFYTQAAERLLREHQGELEDRVNRETTEKQVFFAGVTRLGQNELKKYLARNEKIDIKGYGVLILKEDADELITRTVRSVSVRGKVFCSERVRKIYLPTL